MTAPVFRAGSARPVIRCAVFRRAHRFPDRHPAVRLAVARLPRHQWEPPRGPLPPSMAQNLLVQVASDGSPQRVSALARESGSTLGFVNTCIDLTAMATPGKRIEEEREFGGATYHAFDEPLSVGSAIAQLAGYADAVVVWRLDDWAGRLVRHFTGPDGHEYITAELTAIVSVMNAHMADVLLVSVPVLAGDDPIATLHRRMLAEFRAHTRLVDLTR